MSFELTESQQYDLFFELAKNLSHPSRDVRVSTVFAVSKIANRRCTNLLLDKLELEKDIFIKASLIRILGEIGTPNLLDPLDKYLNHPEPRIRANAVESIVKLKIKEKEPLVKKIATLVRDENNRVASTALKEIIGMGDKKYLPLLKLMLKGTDAARKASAIWVVGELKLNELLDDVVFALYSENYQVHSIANRVLGLFSNDAIQVLFDNLAMGDSLVKVYTFLFFARYLKEVNEEQKKLLLELVETEEPYIASFVLKILYQLKLPEGFELLKNYLFWEEENLRKVSVEGLYCFTNMEGAEELLFKAVDNEKDPHLLARLIQCLEKFPSEKSVERLKLLLEHEDKRVCANAIEVLGKIGDNRLVEFLNPFLENSNNRIMANAAVAVFRLGENKVLNHLKAALGEGNTALRASAAYALGQMDSKDVVEILIERLLDDAQQVRSHVISGLMSNDKEIFNRLVNHLKQSEKRSARKVLAEIGGRVNADIDLQNQIEGLLGGYAEKVNAFEVPDQLEDQEVDKLIEVLFTNDPKLQVYSIYVLGEMKIERAVPRLICLLFERNDELVGEAMLALKKIKAKECLLFLRDIFGRLRGENLKLCAKIMQEFADGVLDDSYFGGYLSPAHKEALQAAATE